MKQAPKLKLLRSCCTSTTTSHACQIACRSVTAAATATRPQQVPASKTRHVSESVSPRRPNSTTTTTTSSRDESSKGFYQHRYLAGRWKEKKKKRRQLLGCGTREKEAASAAKKNGLGLLYSSHLSTLRTRENFFFLQVLASRMNATTIIYYSSSPVLSACGGMN